MSRVLITGTYNPDYPRNKVIIDVLEEEADVISDSQITESYPSWEILKQPDNKLIGKESPRIIHETVFTICSQ